MDVILLPRNADRLSLCKQMKGEITHGKQASKYDGLARIIIQNVGGKQNIKAITHCITRLRFQLVDEGKANTDILNKTDG